MLKLDTKNQNMLIYISFVMYMLVYPAKLNYNALIVEILPELGVTKAAAGLVGSFFFFSYGIGQIICGFTVKYINEKYIMSLSLLGSAICNFLMPFAENMDMMKYIWFANGIVMSTLWCSLIKVLGKYISTENLPRALTFTGFTTPLGTALNYGICALSVRLGNWHISFYTSAILMTVMAIVWFLTIDRVERIAVNTQTDTNQTSSKSMPSKAKELNIGITVLIILGVIFLATSVTQFVREGLNSWVPTILNEVYNTPETLSILLTLAIPLLSALGNVLLVRIERKTKDFLLLTGIFMGIVFVSMGLLSFCYPLNSFLITFICFIMGSTFCACVNNLATNHIPLYYRNKFESGKLAGIAQGFSYVGSTLSVTVLGLIADSGGWLNVFLCLMMITGIMLFVCSALKVAMVYKKCRRNHRIA